MAKALLVMDTNGDVTLEGGGTEVNNVTVIGSLNLRNTGVTEVNNVTTNGNVDLHGTKVKEVHDLTVGQNLYLERGVKIGDNVKVGGEIHWHEPQAPKDEPSRDNIIGTKPKAPFGEPAF